MDKARCDICSTGFTREYSHYGVIPSIIFSTDENSDNNAYAGPFGSVPNTTLTLCFLSS